MTMISISESPSLSGRNAFLSGATNSPSRDNQREDQVAGGRNASVGTPTPPIRPSILRRSGAATCHPALLQNPYDMARPVFPAYRTGLVEKSPSAGGKWMWGKNRFRAEFTSQVTTNDWNPISRQKSQKLRSPIASKSVQPRYIQPSPRILTSAPISTAFPSDNQAVPVAPPNFFSPVLSSRDPRTAAGAHSCYPRARVLTNDASPHAPTGHPSPREGDVAGMMRILTDTGRHLGSKSSRPPGFRRRSLHDADFGESCDDSTGGDDTDDDLDDAASVDALRFVDERGGEGGVATGMSTHIPGYPGILRNGASRRQPHVTKRSKKSDEPGASRTRPFVKDVRRDPELPRPRSPSPPSVLSRSGARTSLPIHRQRDRSDAVDFVPSTNVRTATQESQMRSSPRFWVVTFLDCRLGWFIVLRVMVRKDLTFSFFFFSTVITCICSF